MHMKECTLTKIVCIYQMQLNITLHTNDRKHATTKIHIKNNQEPHRKDPKEVRDEISK